jgi:hypothetical protein
MTAPDQCCSNSESSCQGGAVSALVDSITGGTADVSMTERMPWLGTVRGRLGYIADGLLRSRQRDRNGIIQVQAAIDGIGSWIRSPRCDPLNLIGLSP